MLSTQGWEGCATFVRDSEQNTKCRSRQETEGKDDGPESDDPPGQQRLLEMEEPRLEREETMWLQMKKGQPELV